MVLFFEFFFCPPISHHVQRYYKSFKMSKNGHRFSNFMIEGIFSDMESSPKNHRVGCIVRRNVCSTFPDTANDDSNGMTADANLVLILLERLEGFRAPNFMN